VDSAAAPAATVSPAPGAAVELAVVGMSLNAHCGVRDHAMLLAGELEREGVACSVHWLRREQRALAASRAEIAGWTRRLAGELARERPRAILLHYSVFSYSHRGVPVFVRTTLAPLRGAGVPLLGFMHELAYPLGHGGLRGRVWATTQRAALREVIGASAAAIVTADFRASWLASRWWLARRPVLVAPVFSNIPAPRAQPVAGVREPAVIGLFGYSYESAELTLVLDALRELRAGGRDARLELLGAPGACSPAGRAWSAAAGERAVADRVSFTGALPAQELADALAACDVLMCADATGPSSRKGTLAASLASGVPVVAIDGPLTWRALLGHDAAAVVEPSSRALAGAFESLLADAGARRALGGRGRAFAEQEMSLAASARVVRTLLERALSERPG
jgi:glycosyltransferase involved in cell wall biosynthesis